MIFHFVKLISGMIFVGLHLFHFFVTTLVMQNKLKTLSCLCELQGNITSLYVFVRRRKTLPKKRAALDLIAFPPTFLVYRGEKRQKNSFTRHILEYFIHGIIFTFSDAFPAKCLTWLWAIVLFI